LKKGIARRNRNRLARLNTFLLPVSIFVSVISLVFIIILFNSDRRSKLLSPIIQSYSETLGIEDAREAEIEKALRLKKIEYASIVKYDNSYTIKLSDSEDVILSSQKDLAEQISSLQYILFRLTMEGKQFARLDLRFEKPVVVLK
jgi:hypothetical protein